MSCNCNSACCCCPDENGGNGVVCPPAILTDKFCGTFELECRDPNIPPDPERIVWRSERNGVLAPVIGTVTVSYFGGCADNLLAVISRNGAEVYTLVIPEPEGTDTPNSRSITLQEEFDTLEIFCIDPGQNTCEGQYCLNIHYPSPFTS
jgi:hypothetical protein